MAYLEEFKTYLASQDLPKLLQLWEEYCNGDVVEGSEFSDILRAINESTMTQSLGRYVETALPLWSDIKDERESYEVLRLILDVQTTNSELLADTAFQALKSKYGDHRHFNEKIRLVGLRHRKDFRGAITNYDLLTHLEEGNFVYHTGGWGTGEVMDVSLVREELVIEFENVGGRKHLTFDNAFKTLIALPNDHFLARRFSDPDALEAEAKAHPLQVVKMLLQDLGSKTAAEIKEEMSVLVIPEEDWTKWWQMARAKLKKDTIVSSPATVREPFRLRSEAMSHETLLWEKLRKARSIDKQIQLAYNFVRDFPDMTKREEFRETLQEKLLELYSKEELTRTQKIQITIFFESLLGIDAPGPSVREQLVDISDYQELLDEIEILAFKKQILTGAREIRENWEQLFLHLLLASPQNQVRDYLYQELQRRGSAEALDETLRQLLKQPAAHPEALVWYFQKVIDTDRGPFANKEDQCLFFEALLTVLHALEHKSQYRELLKKIYGLITGKRYAITRKVLEGSTLMFAQEFLLLVSKSHTLNDHDKNILHSLAEVVHPELGKHRTKEQAQHVWTTEQGFQKTRDRVKHISTVEVVENAREIEAARALGDLRENSEYKFALERRSRLQGELKRLSEQLNQARIITPADISLSEAGVGAVIEVVSDKGKKSAYTILGPWDADPEENVLSFQSKLAEAITGLRPGDSFHFKNEDYTIAGIRSYLDS